MKEDAPLPHLLYHADETARILRIGRTRVFALIKSGELGSVAIGRSRLVPASAIDAYVGRLMEQQRNATKEPAK